jgi:hypothetical protein
MGVLDIPPRKYTPITTILGNSTFFTETLYFDGSTVVVWDYCYNNKT